MACRGSDGDPHCVHLVLESQQAVGDAFLVAGQPHPNPLDVTVGEGERELEAGWGEVRENGGLWGGWAEAQCQDPHPEGLLTSTQFGK